MKVGVVQFSVGSIHALVLCLSHELQPSSAVACCCTPICRDHAPLLRHERFDEGVAATLEQLPHHDALIYHAAPSHCTRLLNLMMHA
jgi:hypothetical protein